MPSSARGSQTEIVSVGRVRRQYRPSASRHWGWQWDREARRAVGPCGSTRYGWWGGRSGSIETNHQICPNTKEGSCHTLRVCDGPFDASVRCALRGWQLRRLQWERGAVLARRPRL